MKVEIVGVTKSIDMKIVVVKSSAQCCETKEAVVS